MGNNMKQLVVAAAVLTCLALPARAADWTDCVDSDETVAMRLLLADTDVMSVDTIEMESDGKKWSTAGGAGVTKITKGQGFDTDDQMLVDVTDEKGAEIVAQLRVYKAFEGENYVFGGTLRIAGAGAWAVECASR